MVIDVFQNEGEKAQLVGTVMPSPQAQRTWFVGRKRCMELFGSRDGKPLHDVEAGRMRQQEPCLNGANLSATT